MDLIEIERNEEGIEKIKINLWGLLIVSMAVSMFIPKIVIKK